MRMVDADGWFRHVERLEKLLGRLASRARRWARRPARGAGRPTDGTRSGNALLLTARHLVGMLRAAASEMPSVLAALAARAHRISRAGAFRDGERERDVLVRGERVEQVRVLEDEAQLVAPEPRKLLALRAFVTSRPSIWILPACGRIDGGDAVEQRGLARPARPHDAGELACRHREAHVVERLRHAPVALAPLDTVALRPRCAPPAIHGVPSRCPASLCPPC